MSKKYDLGKANAMSDTWKMKHTIARKIGLKRAWFQVEGSLRHYDCIPTKRALAIQCGAKETNLRDFLKVRRIKAMIADGKVDAMEIVSRVMSL